MSSETEVRDAVKEFWDREKEYLLLQPNEFLAALPKHLLPPKNYIPPLLLTENQWIYRARPADASYMRADGKYIISKYTFSPKKNTIQGRANHESQPMFYGSEFIGATALESRWNMEKDAFIGCWRIKRNSPNIKLAICASRFRPDLNIDISNKLPASRILQLEFLDELFSSDREKQLWIEYKDGKETQKETPRDRVHKLSASIAQHLIEREDVDGILYLSAQAQGTHAVFPPHNEAELLFNVAISPKYVSKHMSLEKVYKVKIESYDDDQGRRRAKRKAIKIGIPINKTKLKFSKLNTAQNIEFEAVHNNAGVPMLLEGPILLQIPRPTNTNRFEELVKSSTCGNHNENADTEDILVNGIDYKKLTFCCDDFCEELKENLRSEGMWWD